MMLEMKDGTERRIRTASSMSIEGATVLVVWCGVVLVTCDRGFGSTSRSIRPNEPTDGSVRFLYAFAHKFQVSTDSIDVSLSFVSYFISASRIPGTNSGQRHHAPVKYST